MEKVLVEYDKRIGVPELKGWREREVEDQVEEFILISDCCNDTVTSHKGRVIGDHGSYSCNKCTKGCHAIKCSK